MGRTATRQQSADASGRAQSLTPENVRGLVRRSLVALGETPDTILTERAAIETNIAELDRKIRLVGQSVLDGVIAPSDAKALNAPLIAQHETAQLKLATLPQQRELPEVDAISPVSPHESGEPSPRAAGYEAPNVVAPLIRPVPSSWYPAGLCLAYTAGSFRPPATRSMAQAR